MIKYVQDPLNNPKPPMRVTNIKEYKDVAETLYKIVAGATGGGVGKDKQKSPMFEALTAPQNRQVIEEAEEDFDITSLANALPAPTGKE
jgi:hypothetical protein